MYPMSSGHSVDPDTVPHGTAVEASNFDNVRRHSFLPASNLSLPSPSRSRPALHGDGFSPDGLNDFTRQANHHLQYSGAGRFWKPPDEQEQKRGFLKRKRRGASVVQPADQAAAASTPALCPISPSSSRSLLSEDRHSLTDDSSSILSERSSILSFQTNQDSHMLKAASSNSPLLTTISQHHQPLAQRIANDERKRKTIQHLKRLHDVEEAKFAEFEFYEEDSRRSISTETVIPSTKPHPNSWGGALPSAMRIDFDIPKNTWNMADLLIGPLLENDIPSSTLAPSKKPKDYIEDVNPEASLALSAACSLSELSSTCKKSRDFEHTPEDYQGTTIAAGPSIHELETQDADGRTLPLLDHSLPTTKVVGEEIRYLRPSPTLETTTLKELQAAEELTSRKISATGDPANEAIQETDDEMNQDSLFVGLNILKRSLPSRNIRPQLLPSQHNVQREPRNMHGSSQGVLNTESPAAEVNPSQFERSIAPPFPELHCELSASPSVIHHPKPRQPSNLAIGHHPEMRQYNTLLHEPFPLSRRPDWEKKNAENISEGTPYVAITRCESQNGHAEEHLQMRISIEPTVDPRTGRAYVNTRD